MLRWLGQVMRDEVRAVIIMNVEGKRRIGRPKRWIKTIQKDNMGVVNVCVCGM